MKIYTAVAQHYDGGMGIYNTSKELGAFFDARKASAMAEQNSSGSIYGAEGYTQAIEVLDSTPSDLPKDIFIAVAVQYDGGMGIYNNRADVGAFFNEENARRLAIEKSGAQGEGYARAVRILDTPPATEGVLA